MGIKISALPTRPLIQIDDLFVLANEGSGLNYKIRLDDLKTQLGDPGMPVLTILLDEVSTSITYIGKSIPGTLTSSPSWQIQRITSIENDLIVEWASMGTYSQAWDNRLSLSYS